MNTDTKENAAPVTLTPIGVIRSPYETPEGMPIQPAGAADTVGEVIVDESLAQGLTDIEGFSHIILLYHFDRSEGYKLLIKPFMDDASHGVFATRAPRRPNPVGLSVVRLLGREGNVLRIQGVDVLDGTPLLDIKPYVPHFCAPGEIRTGWLEKGGTEARTHRSDDRFVREDG